MTKCRNTPRVAVRSPHCTTSCPECRWQWSDQTRVVTQKGEGFPAQGQGVGTSNKKSLPRKWRRRSFIAFEMIELDRASTEPLHQQLYRQIRDELKRGGFNDCSSRLSFSRALAY